MSWIDDRITEREAFDSKRQDILDNAHEVFDALWKQITEFTDEAARKKIQISTNGVAYSRIVRLPAANPKPGLQRPGPELRIELSKDKQSITASATIRYTPITFALDVCRDGVVCLTLNGEELSYPLAAIKLLDPFLFPELPRKY